MILLTRPLPSKGYQIFSVLRIQGPLLSGGLETSEGFLPVERWWSEQE
jgi:hypothetical protein